ncbi:25S rRNA (adenine645-N1)-methyltransferase [Microbotryomycetes sp. JL221]|nr:25S rRNA (adenine645-N1)-methyltransferase [Microbotryomycetes sp. JL221]
MLFDTPGLPSPDKIVTASKSNNKRKRSQDADKQDQVAGAEINLDKLMKKMTQLNNATSDNNNKNKTLTTTTKNQHNKKQQVTTRDDGQRDDDQTTKPSLLQQQQQQRLQQMSQQHRDQPLSNRQQRSMQSKRGKPRNMNDGEQQRGNPQQQPPPQQQPQQQHSSKKQKKTHNSSNKPQQQSSTTYDALRLDPSSNSSKRHSAPTRDDDNDDDSNNNNDTQQQSAPAQTSLQASLRAKLAGGKFRLLNEKLYTTTGSEAAEYMKLDGAFDEYHSGFRSQSNHWPVHPLTLIQHSLIDTLESNSLIADFGCGDATLARKLVTSTSLKVVSFDLVSKDGWVVEAECSSVPLPGSLKHGGQIVDAVVCCLSLMGSDWIQLVTEANRILKQGSVLTYKVRDCLKHFQLTQLVVLRGQLKIAEVTSRFSNNVDEFVQVVSSVGFKLTSKDMSNTHFIMFDFVKEGGSGESTNRAELTTKAAKLLKPCIYKRR